MPACFCINKNQNGGLFGILSVFDESDGFGNIEIRNYENGVKIV